MFQLILLVVIGVVVCVGLLFVFALCRTAAMADSGVLSPPRVRTYRLMPRARIYEQTQQFKR